MMEMNAMVMSYTRPNVNVPWGPNIKSAELEEHYTKEYKETGYLIAEEITFSEDQLTLTRKTAWTLGLNLFHKVKGDALVLNWVNEVRQYNVANSIIPSVTTEEFNTAWDLLEVNICVNPFKRIESLDDL